MAKLQEAIARIRERAAQIGADAKDATAGTKFDAEKTAGDTADEKTKSVRAPGLFASAVNLIMGRSVNELLHEEAKKTNSILDKIEKNTASKNPTTTPRVVADLTPRFA